jgi:hypothetical protein
MKKALSRMKCPLCGGIITDWRNARRLCWTEDFQLASFRERAPEETREAFYNRRLSALRVCTAQEDNEPSFSHLSGGHYLPDLIGEFGQPIVIGLIGSTAAGKTLLLAAMISEFLSKPGILETFGLKVSSLQHNIENRYLSDIEPFCRERKILALTHVFSPDFAFVTRIDSRYARRSFAVAFFDLAGETFYSMERVAMPMLTGASGLIFVIDPTQALPDLVLNGNWGRFSSTGFAAPVDTIRKERARLRDPFIPLPAVSVVTKADLMSGREDFVDKWLSRSDGGDLSSVYEESSDVYALLAARDAKQWLYPAESFMDVTLHFASASGVDAVNGVFPKDGFGPRRVLRPLLSLFAMIGIIDRRPFI